MKIVTSEQEMRSPDPESSG